MKNNFAECLTLYFTNFLQLQRGLSANTISSYSDTFLLLFKFLREEYAIPPEKISFDKIDSTKIVCFCQWLEEKRNSSIKTRNLRLTAIHSFYRFVLTMNPHMIQICKLIIEIPMKKEEEKIPVHLSVSEIKMLLAEPDTNTKQGIRDLTILSLLYETGARVSELINLKLNDLNLNDNSYVYIRGKGRKTRLIPISFDLRKLIKVYLQSNKIDDTSREQYLFINSRGNKLTRPGINYILNKYVQKASEKNVQYFKVKVSAHVIRHSKAMSLLLSGINLIYIRDFLGHSSITTTEHYARTNPEFLRAAIESNSLNFPDDTNYYTQKEKDGLLEFLKTMR
jgi:site-specific recombinase XerD